ncbi:hypothetical protein C0J52_24337 [Blattella germanica]|nr:hypothetical protein C0J52_24337 [Blattella germanica]
MFQILKCIASIFFIIGPKNDPPTAVQEKVLSLIQSWADAFRHQTELSGVVQVYHDLKQKGIEFPMTDLDTMAPIHTPQRQSSCFRTIFSRLFLSWHFVMVEYGRLSVEQRVKVVLLYADLKSLAATQRRFRAAFHTHWAPSRNTILRLYRKLEAEGTLLESERPRTAPVRSPENIAALRLEEEGRGFVFRLSTVTYEWRAVEMDPAGKNPTEIHRALSEICGELTVDRSTVSCWVHLFRVSRMSIDDDPRPGRPRTSTDERSVKLVTDALSIPDAEPPMSVPVHQTHMPTTPLPVSPHAIPPGSPATQPPSQTTQMGPTVLTSDQLGKLQSELDVVQGNMVVLSEMLSELTPGKEHPSDLELLQELHSTCQAMQHRLVELIGKLANDEITAELLRVNDELNNLFLRYNRFENNREACLQNKSPAKTALTNQKPAVDAAGDSLIDLSDEAASPVAAPAPVGPAGAASAASAVPNLNSKLAGLSLGSGNATSQLSMISSVSAQQGSQQKEKEDTEFDIGSTYQDNLEPDQLNAALGAIAQNRTQAVVSHNLSS